MGKRLSKQEVPAAAADSGGGIERALLEGAVERAFRAANSRYGEKSSRENGVRWTPRLCISNPPIVHWIIEWFVAEAL